jgi:hypothetical protein
MMGRDKRVYRFVQDTRYGRRVLAESTEAGEIAEAVTKYIARRMIERERALADDTIGGLELPRQLQAWRRRRRGRAIKTFVLGALVGAAALAAAAWFLGAKP